MLWHYLNISKKKEKYIQISVKTQINRNNILKINIIKYLIEKHYDAFIPIEK